MDSILLARQIRSDVLRMCHRAKTGHVASCLSCADILAVWYSQPRAAKLIVSKGHAAAAVYSVLARTGHFLPDELEHYGEPGSLLACTHVTSTVPGVVHSTGSLGHGLPVACGMALAGQPTAVLMSDAEIQCGTTWEAMMFAHHHDLPVLVIVDGNEWQALGPVHRVSSAHIKEATPRGWMGPYAAVWGHNHGALREQFERPLNRFRILSAVTMKGKGVSFMEQDPLAWHYRSPDGDDLAKALAEIDAGW